VGWGAGGTGGGGGGGGLSLSEGRVGIVCGGGGTTNKKKLEVQGGGVRGGVFGGRGG